MSKRNKFENLFAQNNSNEDSVVLAILIGVPPIETLLSTEEAVGFEEVIYVPRNMTPAQGLFLYADRKPEMLKIIGLARTKSDGLISTLVRAVGKDGIVYTFELPDATGEYYIQFPVEIRTKRHTYVFEDMPFTLEKIKGTLPN